MNDIISGGTISKSRALNICLWVAQTGISALFIAAGISKLILPIAQLSLQVPWTADMPVPFVRFTGLVDLAGGLGVLLPALTRIKPYLTVWAGSGLVILQTLAMAFHLSRGEGFMLPVNVVLFSLALFIAWGRARKAPILPRK